MKRSYGRKSGIKIKHTFYYAKYARKSSEEENSRSVNNQIDVLEAEIQRIKANDPYNEYIDMGVFCDEDYSGTNSNRPDFQKLLKLLAMKKINMLLVTDLSRLSRNNAESLNYVQQMFVALGVRFISTQLPPLDSFLNPDGVYDIGVPVHSMINENHCAETSFKVKRTFDRLRNDGKFIGAFAGYGWKKDEEDKHRLVLDKEPYQVLNMMKNWLFEGYNAGCISRMLNDKGIPNPSGYKRRNGSKYSNSNKYTSTKWSSQAVRKMLSRPENIGDLIQGRFKKISYNLPVVIKTKEDEWYVSENAIPAIFTEEEQERILLILDKSTRVAPQNKTKEIYLFSGILKCPDCGKSIVRKTSRGGSQAEYVYYMCNGYKNYKECTSHSIRHELLEKAVTISIQKQIALLVDIEKVINNVDKAPIVQGQMLDFKKMIEAKSEELKKVKHYKLPLYENFTDGILSREEYISFKKTYEDQMETLNAEILSIQTDIDKLEKTKNGENPCILDFKKYKNIKKLTRDILLDLVDRIYIYEDKRIKIQFKYSDEYKVFIKSLEEIMVHK